MQNDEPRARWKVGVNRTIPAIAKPPVDFKRSDTLWLIRLFHARGQPYFLLSQMNSSHEFLVDRTFLRFHVVRFRERIVRLRTRGTHNTLSPFSVWRIYISTLIMPLNVRLLKHQIVILIISASRLRESVEKKKKINYILLDYYRVR